MRRRGFTLIEMLVVMAIVALLLSLAAPRYFGSVDKAKDNTLMHNLIALRSTLDKFYADKGHYPDSLDELVDKKYLRAIPFDPITGSDRTWVTVVSPDSDVKGIVDVKSGATGQTHEGRSYGSL